MLMKDLTKCVGNMVYNPTDLDVIRPWYGLFPDLVCTNLVAWLYNQTMPHQHGHQVGYIIRVGYDQSNQP